MANEEKFNFESLQDSESIKSFLQSLVDGFEKGSISLSTTDDEIVLSPKGLLNFSVKAKKKPGGSSKMSIKISWKETSKDTLLLEKTINIGT